MAPRTLTAPVILGWLVVVYTILAIGVAVSLAYRLDESLRRGRAVPAPAGSVAPGRAVP